MLALDTNSSVFALTRIRRINDKPIIYLKNYVNYADCPGIETVDFTAHRSADMHRSPVAVTQHAEQAPPAGRRRSIASVHG